MSPTLLMLLATFPGAPTVSAPPIFSAPVPVVKTLASGAKAWVVARPGLPLVHIAVCVSAGSLADPAGQAGLAQLTSKTLEEGGAAGKNPAELLATFDAQGTELRVFTGDTCTTFALTVLSSRLEATVRALLEMLSRPGFDPAAFESVKKRQLAEISKAADEPRDLAAVELRRRLYGDSAAGHLARGDAASVGALTLDDVKKFYAARYAPTGMTFVFVGDVSAESATKLVDGLAPKAWLPAQVALSMLPPKSAEAMWVGVDRPGLTQTSLSLGRVGVLANDATVPELELVATSLGGSFTSRLNQNLREKHGYTYGASSRVVAGHHTGSLVVGTSVRTDVTGDALRETLAEMSGIKTVSVEELAKARALDDANLVSAFDSGQAAAFSLIQLVEAGLPPDDYSKQAARNAAVTPERALAAAAMFDPIAFIVVMVGDRVKIEKQLAKAFPGQVVNWSSGR